MLPAEILSAQPGERVLDLCAAPGGKTLQLAGQMNGRGILFANDVSASRCRALIKNLEAAGVTNAVVLNEKPYKLAERFENFFDAVLVDAPCSGEGMFRRDADAAKAWAVNKPEACAASQRDILRNAARMVSPGGRLVYSTCTFNPEENERMVAEFLDVNVDFEIVPLDHEKLGVSKARPEWADGRKELSGAARIFPHLAEGEGHFAALMKKKGEKRQIYLTQPTPALEKFQPLNKFADDYLNCFPFYGEIMKHESSLFLAPDLFGNIRKSKNSRINLNKFDVLQNELYGLRVARSGFYLGDLSGDRFVPSQALAMALTARDAKYYIDLTESEAEKYLRGESLAFDEIFLQKEAPDKAWTLVCVRGYPLGWARQMNGRLKNHLAKGWVQ